MDEPTPPPPELDPEPDLIAAPPAPEPEPVRAPEPEPVRAPAGIRAVYRHALATRLAHWIAVVCLPVLLLSGLQIFNAHPALYWGDRSDPERRLLALEAVSTPTGEVRGVTHVLGFSLDTTGVLGASYDVDEDALTPRGFPRWATLPSEQWLAMGRRFHFFFAWVLVVVGIGFALWAVASRHVTRDLVPGPCDLRQLGASLLDHLRLRHPGGAAAARYNVLQKLAYTAVIFGLAPLIVLTGLAMSPRFDAIVPFVVRLLGGRQSARTLHFLLTFAFVGFTITHLFMVAITGAANNVRSMITGWYRYRTTEE